MPASGAKRPPWSSIANRHESPPLLLGPPRSSTTRSPHRSGGRILALPSRMSRLASRTSWSPVARIGRRWRRCHLFACMSPALAASAVPSSALSLRQKRRLLPLGILELYIPLRRRRPTDGRFPTPVSILPLCSFSRNSTVNPLILVPVFDSL